jgi:hypothetical protein
MKRKTFALVVVLAALSPLFFSCDMFRMDEADFSKALLRSVTDKGYVEEQAKAAFEGTEIHAEEGLTIEVDLIVELKLKATFTGYPYYGSTVTGVLWADLDAEIDGEAGILSVTLTFNTYDPHLTVTGKHAGTYAFDNASVTYDFTTQTYSFAGTVTADGGIYDLAGNG